MGRGKYLRALKYPRSMSQSPSPEHIEPPRIEYVEALSRGQILRGFLHHAEGEPGGAAPLVMLWHGFTGTKVEPHRVLVGMARRLAASGIAAVRFDFWGSGDSDGDFQHATPETEVEDALAVLAWARAQGRFDSSRLGLIGLSLGGWVSACAAGRDRGVRALCLWAATARIGQRFEASLTPEQREHAQQHGWWDMNGNRIGRDFIPMALAVDPTEQVRGHSGAALVVHGARDQTVPPEEGEAYARALGCPLHVIAEGDHTFNRAVWEDELFEVSQAFFRRELA